MGHSPRGSQRVGHDGALKTGSGKKRNTMSLMKNPFLLLFLEACSLGRGEVVSLL